MNKFKFRYGISVKILIGAVIIISTAGVIANVLSVLRYAGIDTVAAISYSLLALLTAILCAESVAIAFYGVYKIKNGCVYAYFGFIYTKIDVFDVVGIKIFEQTQKLTLYLKNGKFTVIIIAQKYYKDFSSALLKINPEISYEMS